MWRYTLRRLSFLFPILFLVSLITFVLLRVLPGQDPAQVLCGLAGPECTEPVRQQLGLSKPIHEQYLDWMGGVLQGDLGTTYFGKRDILDEVARRLPVSAELVLISLMVSVVLGVTFGVMSAVMRNSPIDYAVRLAAVFGQSIPEFFLLILLIVVPSILFNYAAPGGGRISIFEDPWLNLRVYLPPALVLGFGGAAGIMRLQRTTMLEVLRTDYVRTARAKGLKRSDVILKHAFRNTLAPLVTVIGTSFTLVFSGSVIAERVMSIDGLGPFFISSVLAHDYPVVQFLVLYTGAAVILVNLIVDLSYAWIDPRVKYR